MMHRDIQVYKIVRLHRLESDLEQIWDLEVGTQIHHDPLHKEPGGSTGCARTS